MPLYKYIVICDTCNWSQYAWAANSEEAVWGAGVDPKTAKCPKCEGGQLKATTSTSPLPTLTELEEKLKRSWEPADEK